MIVIADTTPLNYLILIDLPYDETRGWQEAMRRGFNLTGTVGILDRAGTQRAIDVPAAVTRLRQTNFRIAPHLLNVLLDRYKS